MKKAAMFPKSETEYLFVEMKTMPVCLIFQQSIWFSSHPADCIHLHYLPASWRYLSLPSLPCKVSALLLLSSVVGGVSHLLYSLSQS